MDILLGNLRQEEASTSNMRYLFWRHCTYQQSSHYCNVQRLHHRTVLNRRLIQIEQPSKVQLTFIKISHHLSAPEQHHLPQFDVSTTSSAKCLDVLWQYNLMVEKTVKENITKAGKGFLHRVDLMHFWDTWIICLPLVFSYFCVLPILIWMRDVASRSDNFILPKGFPNRRILKLLSFFWNLNVRYVLYDHSRCLEL